MHLYKAILFIDVHRCLVVWFVFVWSVAHCASFHIVIYSNFICLFIYIFRMCVRVCTCVRVKHLVTLYFKKWHKKYRVTMPCISLTTAIDRLKGIQTFPSKTTIVILMERKCKSAKQFVFQRGPEVQKTKRKRKQK